LPVLAFLFASLSIAAVGARMLQLRHGLPALVSRRLQDVRLQPAPVSSPPSAQALVKALKGLGARVPRSPGEMGRLQLRMTQAGYRGSEALPIFYGVRVVLAIGAFLLFATPVLIRPDLIIALSALGVAYLLPGMWIGRLAKRRQHRIQLALADVLDLLVVCVEAGLGLDQAMVRVGQELEFAFPDLADELRIVNLELRAGKPRIEALKNLADRTGIEDVRSLVSMLVQTDRFGTSIAQSLRVHSDTLRTKRRQRAEEAAAKTGVKMVFPLVFCVFPAIWVVTIGPAALQFMTVLMPMVKK
jgi:tight adherence protein C